jgi:hypothetical protein
LRLEELLRHVAGDLQALGDRAALSHQSLDLLGGRQIDPFGELLDVRVEHAFHMPGGSGRYSGLRLAGAAVLPGRGIAPDLPPPVEAERLERGRFVRRQEPLGVRAHRRSPWRAIPTALGIALLP